MFYYRKGWLSSFIMLLMFSSKLLSAELYDYSFKSLPQNNQATNNSQPAQNNKPDYSVIKAEYSQKLKAALPMLTLDQMKDLLAAYDKQYDEAVKEGLTDKAQVFADLKLIILEEMVKKEKP